MSGQEGSRRRNHTLVQIGALAPRQCDLEERDEHKSAFDPRDYLKPAREAAKQICKQRYEQFGCAGMASKIKPVPLGRVAERYKRGELRQIVN
jgi:hypothetical protein